jgi:DnaJ homolog subfamily B member 11
MSFIGLSLLTPGVHAFFEQIFQQAFQGGHEISGPDWPEDTPSIISKQFSFLKGTEWLWSNWRKVRFHGDGRFEAPTHECQYGCYWSSDAKAVYILWGDYGVHELKPNKLPSEDTVEGLKGIKFSGIRRKDKSRVTCEFSSIFDFDHRGEKLDLYKLMEIDEDADAATLKKQFRTLSVKYHPDRNTDPKATERFRDITTANEILSDPVKRYAYDKFGHEGLKKLERGELSRTKDKVLEVDVPLHIIYSGGEMDVKYTRRIICKSKDGCKKCPAEIKNVQQQIAPGFFITTQAQVQSKDFCRDETKTEKISVLASHRTGAEIVILAGADHSSESIPGNVVFRLKEKRHPQFTRKGDDLHLNVRISLEEALLGFYKEIKHVDGSTVEIEKDDKITKPYEVIALDELGLAGDSGSRGKLLATVEVVFPKKLSEQQKEALRKVFSENKTDSKVDDEL